MSTTVEDLSMLWKEVIDNIECLKQEQREIKEQVKELEITKKLLREKIWEHGGSCKYRKKQKWNERHNQMLELFKSGRTLEEIGQEFGITRERVRQILKKYGVTGKNGGKSIQILAKENEVKMLTKEGLSTEEIAEKLSISEKNVRRIANKIGIKVHNAEGVKFLKIRTEIKNLHDHGLKQLEIAEKLGVAQGFVSKVLLEDYGIRKRNTVDFDELKRLHGEGLSVSELAARFNSSYDNIYQLLKYRLGLEINKVRGN